MAKKEKQAEDKSKIKTYYTPIEISMFRAAILVVVSESMEDIIEDWPSICKEFKIPEDEVKDEVRLLQNIYDDDCYMPPGQTIRFANDAGDVVILFKGKNIADISQENIVHETHHAATYTCDYRGIKDEETEAYMQEYLFNEIICRIDDWNNKHKKK